MATLLSVPSYATTMCAANDSVAIVLDPTITGTSGYAVDTEMGTWHTKFHYGYISGISACLNSDHGQMPGSWIANLTDTNNEDETNMVTGTERYGHYCWCKATHPVSSRWVFLMGNIGTGSVADCVSGCAGRCGSNTQNNLKLRNGIFGSIDN